LCAAGVGQSDTSKHLLPMRAPRTCRLSNNAPLGMNAMKLRSLVIRAIFAWLPIMPPAPLIARPQREASSMRPPVHVVVTAEAR
jgi:hypothetical protein